MSSFRLGIINNFSAMTLNQVVTVCVCVSSRLSGWVPPTTGRFRVKLGVRGCPLSAADDPQLGGSVGLLDSQEVPQRGLARLEQWTEVQLDQVLGPALGSHQLSAMLQAAGRAVGNCQPQVQVPVGFVQGVPLRPGSSYRQGIVCFHT